MNTDPASSPPASARLAFSARRILRVLLIALAAVPAVYCGCLIHRNGVDVPYWDEWDLVPLYEKAVHGALTWADLFRQNNEHRIVVPVLLRLGLAPWTKGNELALMWANLAMAALTAAGLAVLLRRATRLRSQEAWLVCLALANAVVFSAAQAENWLWGMETQFFLPNLFLVAALLVIWKWRRPWIVYPLCMTLAALSTFSSANGSLLWVVLLPALAWPRPAKERTGGAAWAVAWLIGLALCAWVYSIGYARPKQIMPLSLAFQQPGAAVHYFLAFLGGSMGTISTRLAIPWATGVGAGELAALGLLAADAAWRSDRSLTWRAWILGAPALFAVGSAAMTALGRIGFGVAQSLSSRYTTMSGLLPIGLIGSTALVCADAKEKGLPVAKRIVALAAAGAVALAALELLAACDGGRLAANLRVERAAGKAQLLMVRHFQYPSMGYLLFTKVDVVRVGADLLDQIGYLRPPLVRTDSIWDLQAVDGGSLGVRGKLEGAKTTGPHEILAHGWAAFEGLGREADSVLLVLENQQGQGAIVGLADMGGPSDQRPAYPRSGWEGKLRTDAWPRTALWLRAWAFDVSTGKAYPLDGTVKIDQTP